MTSAVDGPWILCRVATGLVIVIMESDYNQWSKTYPKNYEFIAKGKRVLMQRFQKLTKDYDL
jgi:hypothetical protein